MCGKWDIWYRLIIIRSRLLEPCCTCFSFWIFINGYQCFQLHRLESLNMAKKQLLTQLVCSLTVWIIGNGLAPLLPVWASKLGASSSVIGYYLSFCFVLLTVGTLAAGWLSDKLQNRKKLLITAGVITIPITWLMGNAENIWQLIGPWMRATNLPYQPYQ